MRATYWASVVVASAVLVGGADPAMAKDSDKTVVVGDLGKECERAADGAGGFWGSVLVAKGGEVVFAKGYGMADFDRAPCTPATLYELASVSKQVTATAILHLEQRGKLSTGDSIGRFFKKVPDDKKAITVHHLLTHTAGLHDGGVSYADPIPTARYVEAMMAKPLQAEPGTTFKYSNVGYALLGCIVEIVGKTDFEKYCEKHLFKPAKMKDTGFIGDKDLIKSKRVSLRKDKGKLDRSAADWNWGWGYRGMGGVVTTVLDMHRWDQALRGDAILDEEHRAKLYAPNLQHYAGGWKIAVTDRGSIRASHSGGVAGYKTNCVRYIEDDVMFVVLGNDGEKTFAVSGALDKLLFTPVEMEATLDVSGLDGGALGPKARFSVKKKKGVVTLRLTDGKREAMVLGAPLGVAKKLLFDLAQAVRDRRKFDDGAKPSVKASLNVERYDRGLKKHKLTKGVRAVGADPTRRNERGEPVIEPTIRFALYDFDRGGRPVTADMDVAAAKELAEALRKALE